MRNYRYRTDFIVVQAKMLHLFLDLALREKSKLEGKVNSLKTKQDKLATELEEERQLNRSLRQNQVGFWWTLVQKMRV